MAQWWVDHARRVSDHRLRRPVQRNNYYGFLSIVYWYYRLLPWKNNTPVFINHFLFIFVTECIESLWVPFYIPIHLFKKWMDWKYLRINFPWKKSTKSAVLRFRLNRSAGRQLFKVLTRNGPEGSRPLASRFFLVGYWAWDHFYKSTESALSDDTKILTLENSWKYWFENTWAHIGPVSFRSPVTKGSFKIGILRWQQPIRKAK